MSEPQHLKTGHFCSSSLSLALEEVEEGLLSLLEEVGKWRLVGERGEGLDVEGG